MGRNSPSKDDRGSKTAADPHQNSRDDKVETIPVVEEQVEIGKRMVDGRTVRVTTRVVGEEVSISEPVRHDEVTVERVAIGTVVDEIPEIREEGDLTVIPVVEERVKVTRELVLKEEIHLLRKSTTSTHDERVTLNRTQVVIEEDS